MSVIETPIPILMTCNPILTQTKLTRSWVNVGWLSGKQGQLIPNREVVGSIPDTTQYFSQEPFTFLNLFGVGLLGYYAWPSSLNKHLGFKIWHDISPVIIIYFCNNV